MAIKRAVKRKQVRPAAAAGGPTHGGGGIVVGVGGGGGGATGGGGAGGVVAPMAIASRLRIPLSLDPMGQSGSAIADTLHTARLAAVSNLFDGIQQVHSSLGQLLTGLADPLAPPQLIGALVQPDGTPGARLQLQFDP